MTSCIYICAYMGGIFLLHQNILQLERRLEAALFPARGHASQAYCKKKKMRLIAQSIRLIAYMCIHGKNRCAQKPAAAGATAAGCTVCGTWHASQARGFEWAAGKFGFDVWQTGTSMCQALLWMRRFFFGICRALLRVFGANLDLMFDRLVRQCVGLFCGCGGFFFGYVGLFCGYSGQF